MSAYVVLIMNQVNGLEWLPEYQSKVPAIVQHHGGEYIAMSNGFKGEHIRCVDGAAAIPDAIGLLRFPAFLPRLTTSLIVPCALPKRRGWALPLKARGCFGAVEAE
jgi:uncharacterized protein (DUF1330 family)